MATEKDLINGNASKKKYEFMDGFQDAKRKKSKDPGNAYVCRNGVPAISPSSEIQICKCSHQCHKLTLEDKQSLFNLFHQKTCDEQSEYIVYYCMDLMETKKKKVDKTVSQRQTTFHYKLQIGPKILAVCQRTLCSVLGVTPRRIQILQNKIKTASQDIGLSDSLHENLDNGDVLKPDRELLNMKMYQLFSEKYPEVQISHKMYKGIWRETCSDLNENEFLEDIDDPVNDRLIYQNLSNVKVEEPVRDSLEADGQLGRIKAEMRTEVMKLLDGSSKSSRVKRPKSPHDVLLLNELIREYFDWIGYKYTSNVFISECELGKQPLDRSFLAQDLGVKETEKSRSLPLLFCLIEAFKELKASSMSSC